MDKNFKTHLTCDVKINCLHKIKREKKIDRIYVIQIYDYYIHMRGKKKVPL